MPHLSDGQKELVLSWMIKGSPSDIMGVTNHLPQHFNHLDPLWVRRIVETFIGPSTGGEQESPYSPERLRALEMLIDGLHHLPDDLKVRTLDQIKGLQHDEFATMMVALGKSGRPDLLDEDQRRDLVRRAFDIPDFYSKDRLNALGGLMTGDPNILTDEEGRRAMRDLARRRVDPHGSASLTPNVALMKFMDDNQKNELLRIIESNKSSFNHYSAISGVACQLKFLNKD